MGELIAPLPAFNMDTTGTDLTPHPHSHPHLHSHLHSRATDVSDWPLRTNTAIPLVLDLMPLLLDTTGVGVRTY